MSFIEKKPTAAEIAPDWLKAFCLQFDRELAKQGYTTGSRRSYDRAAVHLCREIVRRKIQEGQLNGVTLEAIHSSALEAMHPSKHVYKRYCLQRFVDAMVSAGIAERLPPPLRQPTARDRLREGYETYLREQRGLTEGTIYCCVRFLERFMTFRFGEGLGDLNDIAPADVVAFVCEVMGRKPGHRDKTPPTHLRNLFRFLFWSGKTKHDLAASFPRVARARAERHLARSLKPEEIEQLIHAVWASTAVGRRNYAMVLLLARLGLRAVEVITIQLDDIDWRAGTILIRGKGKRHDRMPLPEDAGEAIVDYIKNGRRGASRTLFLSNKVPYRPFVNAEILNTVLRAAFDETGLKPPQKYIGSHLFRHSLATNMLRKGASLDEIGDVLRHRSRTSTAIYAKHDVEGLRSIAAAWPAMGGHA